MMDGEGAATQDPMAGLQPVAPSAEPSGLTISDRGAGALPQTVALIGLMGAGKTAVGRRLAQVLGAPFRDADDEIERAANMSIPDFFTRYGEPAFREGERRVIARLLAEPPHVLATGGGAFMDPDTRAALAQHAVTVWLRADLETLVQRCARRSNRPLLAGGDMRARLSDLMTKRYPVYAEADVVVDSVDGPHDAAVAAVKAALMARAAARSEAGS